MSNNEKKIARAIELSLGQFESVAEMDKHIKQHRAANKYKQLGKMACELLDKLAQWSRTIPGVSWRQVDSMAGKLNKSDRTIRRALVELENAAIVQRVQDMRESGGNGSNYIVILPFIEAGVTENVRPNVRPSVSACPGAAKPTAERDEDDFFEPKALNSFKALKEKREEDIYKQSASAREISFFEIELKEQGLENGLPEAILDGFIDELRRQNLDTYTARDITTAFTDYDRVMRKIANGERDRVYNPASYFVTLLRTAIVNNQQLDRVREQEAAAEEARRQEQAALVAEFGEFTFYNWLEEQDSEEPAAPIYVYRDNSFRDERPTFDDLDEINAEFKARRA